MLNALRIRWKSLIPLLGVLGTWLASPQALSLVSDKNAHILLAISSLIAVLTPALLTNRPKTTSKRIKGNVGTDPQGDSIEEIEVPPSAKIPAKERGDWL